MRIGIYDPYFDDTGGGEKYIMTAAECLSKQHDVSVFWDNKEDLEAVKKRFSLDLDRVMLRPNIFSGRIGLWQKLQETQKYDVLIVMSDGSVPFVLSKKLFLHIQQPLQQAAVTSWKGKLKLSRVTGIFYNSEFTKHFNDKLLSGVKSTVIYPPVSLKVKEVKKENIILHVGRFRVQDVITGVRDFKKQSVMVEAFVDMAKKKEINDWKFVLAVSVKKEDEERFEALKKSAEGYPIEFFINETNDELWTLYNKAKIYWHASGFGEDLEKHPEYAEHFGISTVEAMGAGAVPVVINAGGQKEIVTDMKNGLLWDTIGQFQEKTEKVMKDHKLWESLSENAQKRAKDFSKEQFASQISKIVV